jgi:hypothetical protein
LRTIDFSLFAKSYPQSLGFLAKNNYIAFLENGSSIAQKAQKAALKTAQTPVFID